MKVKYLSIILFIVAYLISIELVLEYRAKERGFSTYFLGKKNSDTASEAKSSSPFSYRSSVISLDKTTDVVRIWMASASYAEDTKRKINELFPNILCSIVSEEHQPCQMLNAAKAGYAIKDNILQLKIDAKKWRPDYVLLYSMNLDINNLSDQYLGLKTAEPSNNESNDVNRTNIVDLSISERIEKIIEQMTIYGHVRRYIGGEVLFSTLLHDEIGAIAPYSFKKTLNQFIQACKEIGAKPILVTFATQYNISNYESMTHDQQLTLLRYNEYLSRKGWVNTVSEFNTIIRQTASENNLPYIDLAKEIGGKKGYFTDFVHFTKEGHEIVGSILASEFLHIINTTMGKNP